MKCHDVERGIFLYEELTEGERQEVDEHILNCASCRKTMEHANAADQLIRRHRANTPPLRNAAAMTQRIMVAVGARKERGTVRTSHGQRFFMPAFRYAMAALSLVLAISFVVESAGSGDMPELHKRYPDISSDKPLLNVAAFRSAWVHTRDSRQQSTMLSRCVASCPKEECEDCANIFSKHLKQ
jgi:hypothetical protein